jgi:hypothetical protein
MQAPPSNGTNAGVKLCPNGDTHHGNISPGAHGVILVMRAQVAFSVTGHTPNQSPTRLAICGAGGTNSVL